MLDHEERNGFIRMLVGGIVVLASFISLMLLNISPTWCGAGLIWGAVIGFWGQIRVARFYPFEDKENRPMIAILMVIDIVYIAATLFGAMLSLKLI